jgi:hypothetical protein
VLTETSETELKYQVPILDRTRLLQLAAFVKITNPKSVNKCVKYFHSFGSVTSVTKNMEIVIRDSTWYEFAVFLFYSLIVRLVSLMGVILTLQETAEEQHVITYDQIMEVFSR